LLLFSAFLFLPDLLFFFALITFSAPVFETMITILSQYVTKLLNLLSRQYLYISLRNVKTYSFFFLITLSIDCNSSSLPNLSYLLSIGEHVELPLKNISYFNIGNKEILASSSIDQKNVLIIKALAQGECEVLLKYFSGKTKTIQFTVVKKSKRLKIKTLTQRLRAFGLKVASKGELIYTSGEITKIEHLNQLLKLKSLNTEIQLGAINISKRNRNNHIADIYNYFWRDQIKEVFCRYTDLKYQCFYHSNKLSKNMIKVFKNFKFLDVIKLENSVNKKVCLDFSFWQVSLNKNSNNTLENDKALLDLQNPSLFFSRPIQIILSDENAKAKLLSEKKIYLSPGNKAKVSSGVKIPIVNKNDSTGNTTTRWKFIGLKTSLKLNKIGQDYEVSLTNDISTPLDDLSFSYDKTETTINLTHGQRVIFIRHHILQNSHKKTPLIPISYLKDIEITKIKTKRSSTKYIMGTIKISNQCSPSIHEDAKIISTGSHYE
jgi:hypothetical protein